MTRSEVKPAIAAVNELLGQEPAVHSDPDLGWDGQRHSPGIRLPDFRTATFKVSKFLEKGV